MAMRQLPKRTFQVAAPARRSGADKNRSRLQYVRSNLESLKDDACNMSGISRSVRRVVRRTVVQICLCCTAQMS